LLLEQEGAAMFSVDLSIRECGGRVVVGLRGELDIADAVSVAASLAAIAVGQPQIIVDLAGLEFIDSSGVAALARGRKLARQAGGDMLLAAPREQVLRVLACIRLSDAFRVHPSVDEAVGEVTQDRLSGASGTARAARLLCGSFAAGDGEGRRSQQEDGETTAAGTTVLSAGSPDIHQPPSGTAAITHQEPL
jgi:anti-sigma B factor antagonist